MLSLMLVFVLLRIACVGMLVRMLMLVFVVVFVSVRDPVVVVFVSVRMSVLVLVFMLVAMIVLAFHQILLQSPRRVDNQLRQPNLSAT